MLGGKREAGRLGAKLYSARSDHETEGRTAVPQTRSSSRVAKAVQRWRACMRTAGEANYPDEDQLCYLSLPHTAKHPRTASGSDIRVAQLLWAATV